MKHLVENTPRHTGIILDKLSNDQLTIRLAVDNLDEAIKGLNRAADRYPSVWCWPLSLSGVD